MFSITLGSKILENPKEKRDLADEKENLQYNRLKKSTTYSQRQRIVLKNIATNEKSTPKAFWQYKQSILKTRSQIPDIIKPGTLRTPKTMQKK